MLTEPEQRFICTNCGVPSRTFHYRCPYCHIDGRLIRDKPKSDTVQRRIARFDQLATQQFERIDTGIPSLNHVLGGGLVPGSVVVVYGQPGTGKSTMLLQAACSPTMGRTLCISGEEAGAQVTMNLQRLGLTTVTSASFLHSSSTAEVLAAIMAYEPNVAFVDSAQSFVSERAQGSPGSSSQIKRLVEDLVRVAKATQIAIVIVGQVNAAGKLAGPKKMPHWVDVVIEAKDVAIGGNDYVQLWAPTKNRFGATGKKHRAFLEKRDDGLFSIDIETVKPKAAAPAEVPPRPAPKLLSGADLVAQHEQRRAAAPQTLEENTAVPGRVTPSGLVVIDGGRVSQETEAEPDLLDTLTHEGETLRLHHQGPDDPRPESADEDDDPFADEPADDPDE